MKNADVCVVHFSGIPGGKEEHASGPAEGDSKTESIQMKNNDYRLIDTHIFLVLTIFITKI
ncbi:hypothetical protein [Nitrosomonas sp.]|uniref:hypothetical protein n=1 Tax=Nitrosomonas sp. TaxID=42353 RepID=UPI0033058344